jgi:beta-RFAP synthase
MIDSPGIDLIARSANEASASGPLAERIKRLLSELPARFAEMKGRIEAAPAFLAFEVLKAPPEHVGLGVGTQISLAVTRASLELATPSGARDGIDPNDVRVMSRLSGRGARSGIGLHGFCRGGLIVDGGRGKAGSPPPLLARHPFPEEWSILIVQPPGPGGLHGEKERSAFEELPPVPLSVTDRLCRRVLLELLPALIERDLHSFGGALSEIQREVGACFAPAQASLYATPRSSEILAELHRLGLVGGGQSSWGPTLYAFGSVDETEKATIASRVRTFFSLEPARVFWTRAANQGARVEWLPASFGSE